MIKRLHFLIFILMFSCFSTQLNAQNNDIQLLFKALNQSKQDTNRVNLLNKISAALVDEGNVLWTFTSANGFEITQTQMIIIHDVTTPVTTGTLPAITTSCALYSVNTVPTAMDNCEGIIEGSTNDLPVLTIGSTFITWNFVDSDGNTSTQLQEVIFTPINDTITFDGTSLTVGESNATYQWYYCSTEYVIVGETNQTFTPTSDGIYAVLVDNGECNALSDCFTITNLSVDEMQTTQFTLFPNPSNGMITIQSQAPLTLVITTTTGQTVCEGVINSGNTSIDLSGYAAGVYYATSNSSNGLQQTRKITLTK